MPLSPREAFKVGFISRCVEEGLDLPQTHARVKEALDKLAGLTDLPGKLLDLSRPVTHNALAYGIPLALAAPPIIGGVGGYLASKGTDIDDTDVEEIQRRELIDEYRRQTARLLQLRQLRERTGQGKAPGRLY
jgi:hypothetical protein